MNNQECIATNYAKITSFVYRLEVLQAHKGR